MVFPGILSVTDPGQSGDRMKREETRKVKAVILEGNSVNPGDISWEPVTSLCETTIYENTLDSEKWDRIAGHEVVLINKVPMTF